MTIGILSPSKTEVFYTNYLGGTQDA
jgi:hypothetical protein